MKETLKYVLPWFIGLSVLWFVTFDYMENTSYTSLMTDFDQTFVADKSPKSLAKVASHSYSKPVQAKMAQVKTAR